MQQQGVRQALAFDQHFQQAGFEGLLRRDPS
jgi:predicted nucleic acid-binding protein